MRIYFDLDETLIHSIPAINGHSGKRTTMRLKTSETYLTLARPLAQQMISEAKKLGETRILTTASREYALLAATLFNFDFAPDDIIALEDYTFEISTPYGGKDFILKTVKSDPTAALIDNLPQSNPHISGKCRFLGIPETQFIQIREFNGKDPDCFSQKEWPEIFAQLQNLQQQLP